MFSPATRKPHQKGRNLSVGAPDSPATPLAAIHNQLPSGASSIPDRPTTGTPAPWASRLSVIARIPPTKGTEKGADADPTQPVFVGEFPQVVRSAQADFLKKSVPGEHAVCVIDVWKDQLAVLGDGGISGGIDKETSLSWIICGNKLFVWSYLSPIVSKNCVVLEIPSFVLENGDISTKFRHGSGWMVCVVNWDSAYGNTDNVVRQCNSAGVVVCNQKTQAVIFWPDIYSEGGSIPIVSPPPSDKSRETASPGIRKTTPSRHQQPNWTGSSSRAVEANVFNSLIASAIPGLSHECVAIACCSKGEMWRFRCTASGIHREKVSQDVGATSKCGSDNGQTSANKGYARSLVWRSHQLFPSGRSGRQFFLMTDHEIQCWDICLIENIKISRLWSHEIVGTDGDLGIKKDLAGQKQIWLLDMQVDDSGKEFTILVATLCKDGISGSSYTQYSLLTMQYKTSASLENSGSTLEMVLEKKAPIQVIIPKAKVEDENILFSMRLRVGGKPSGSAVILSGDGTATVTNYRRGLTRLYQFDLPWDAGKVLDSSVFRSTEIGEEGAWVVMTEKAGIWAIPEEAVLLGGVEPPERSLSRKGTSNDRTTEEEKRSLVFGGIVAPRRVSSEAWDAGNRRRDVLANIAHRTAQDEESEALLGRFFHDFLSSGQVEGVFEKLESSGAFQKDGETNVFARTSKSIVDTLAKHWTTTRGAEIVAMAVVSSQLLDKQQKHQRYLQFLALSKCHEELRSKQRHSLQTIMEHGEKLASMIQIRDLQNMLNQNRSNGCISPYSDSPNEMCGSLWDLIQLVGDKSRRNTVLLMDRDNAEVFYRKISDLEEVFYCLSNHLQYIIKEEQPFAIQIQRACELSNACTTIIRTAMHYKDVHQAWYPSPEGLTPWYCQPVVCSGLWSVASFILQLLQEATGFDLSSKSSDIFSHLEGLTDVILEAYAGAITAKIERGEEHKGLVDEQCKRRDLLLDSLYQQVKGLVEARYQGLDQGTDIDGIKEANLRELSTPVLSIAKRNEGYQTLWNICCDLNDTGLLRTLMHDSVGPKAGFSYFVFKQLYEKHQYAKLLRLGEDFQEELAIFLKEHEDLLWLHEIFLNHFSAASETLHALALSNDDGSNLVTDDGPDSQDIKKMPSLADRRRLLNLSKIATVAGRDADFELKTQRIEADLHILKLQEEIMSLFSDDKEKQDTTQLFSPAELIEICLKSRNRELSLLSFDVFAWTSSSFRRSNRSLLDQCWKNAADQDDWAGLYQASLAEGWSDEENLQHLRETVLFQASSRCYSPDAQIYEGGFEEVLPLRQEGIEYPMLKDPGSVEGVLMQHEDFPDAGKLMVTAIMLGMLGGTNVEAEDDALME